MREISDPAGERDLADFDAIVVETRIEFPWSYDENPSGAGPANWEIVLGGVTGLRKRFPERERTRSKRRAAVGASGGE